MRIIMLKPTDHFHGSDLEKIEAIYHIKKEDITSFSANVNPLGISPLLRQELANNIDAITTYPDREYNSLRGAISEYIDIPMKDIAVGNGSTELISLFMKLIKPKKALILGPTYSEYERELSLCGSSVLYHRLKESEAFKLNLAALEQQLNHNIDLLVICNPNNPTSQAIKTDTMRDILDLCKQYGIYVLVDETYVEFAPNYEEITAVNFTGYYSNLIILRGISKFFAAPGLRLGYAICGNEDLLKELNQLKNPWTINSLAAIAGEIMFRDEDYIKKSRDYINKEREYVLSAISNFSHAKYYEPMGNFILIKILDQVTTSSQLFDTCMKQGLMIRDCSSFPFLDNSYIRFCFMSHEKNEELLHILKQALQ